MKRLYHNVRGIFAVLVVLLFFVTSNNEAATAGCSVSIDLSSLEYGRVGPAGARGRQRWAEALG